MRRSSEALPCATLRRRTTTLSAVVLAAFAALVAVLGAPAAHPVVAAPVAAAAQGPKGSATGPSSTTPGTPHRTARSTRITSRVTSGAAARAVSAAQTATVAGALVQRAHLVASSAGPSPDGAHQLLLTQPAVPPHTAAPAPPVTPLLRATVAVPLPAGRLLAVAPGRSPPSDPRRA